MQSFELKIVTTKHPEIIKLEANQILRQGEGLEFNNIEEAHISPLAQQLFYLPFVKSVYISDNFIAIAKYDVVAWLEVQEELLEQVQDYLNHGGIIIKDSISEKTPITIYAESTPNPAVIKFVANKNLVSNSLEFKSIEDTKNAPFVQELFHFPFVKEVFLDKNYISITKYDIVDWREIVSEIRNFIQNYLGEGKPITTGNITSATNNPSVTNTVLDKVSKKIVTILEEHIQPAVATDGGNIVFQSYDKANKVVNVVLQGACSGCPSSVFTLKNGIEQLLKEMLPEKVDKVVAINA